MSQTYISFIFIAFIIIIAVYLIMKTQVEQTKLIILEIRRQNTDDKACQKCGNPYPIINQDGECECDDCGNKWEL